MSTFACQNHIVIQTGYTLNKCALSTTCHAKYLQRNALATEPCLQSCEFLLQICYSGSCIICRYVLKPYFHSWIRCKNGIIRTFLDFTLCLDFIYQHIKAIDLLQKRLHKCNLILNKRQSRTLTFGNYLLNLLFNL